MNSLGIQKKKLVSGPHLHYVEKNTGPLHLQLLSYEAPNMRFLFVLMLMPEVWRSAVTESAEL